MMGRQLNQTLKSLCRNTGWNYAVFWKLRHQAPMMLSWENAYYDNCGPSENNWSTDIASICDVHFSHDSLRLAMEKMPYHVYSLGEGIVGQVAVTGKHMWISEDKHVIDSHSFKACFNFSAGCELYDALGPAFKNQNTSCDWETPKSGAETVVQIINKGMCSSNLTMVNPGSEHLLDAVVANVCRSVSDVKHENTLSGSTTCLLTDAFSSSHNKCGQQMKRPKGFDKINKKRSRPGENGKPRPRDRQLIQGLIKELRKLVPDGFKCSIDALLERTIKHLLFLQCTTKHADKLDKRDNSMFLEKENAVCQSSSYEQGSSWAVEVRSELGVLPIIVENSNTSGQMTVEMLCDDCSTFFEIVEAIRSLDLTILKGTTEAYSGKILIHLLVESVFLHKAAPIAERELFLSTAS